MGKGRKRILEGHRSEKGLIRAPMNRMGMENTSFIELMLPELIWLGIARELEGRDGKTVFREMEKLYEAVGGAKKENGMANGAFASSWGKLAGDKKTAAKEATRKLKWVPTAAEIMCRRYPDCPIEILRNNRGRYEDATKRARKDWEIILKATLAGMDREGTGGLMLRGALFHYRIMSQTIALEKGAFRHEEFEAALTDPTTEEGRRGASFLRTFALTEWTIGKGDRQWAETFWETNREKTGCLT